MNAFGRNAIDGAGQLETEGTQRLDCGRNSGSFKRCDFLKSFALFLFAFCVVFFFAVSAQSQGTLNFVVADDSTPLASRQEALQLGGFSGPQLTFDFGFFSAEVPAPGVFLDSFSVTLQGSSFATALLLTVDASGVVWAPNSPGGIPFPESYILRTPITPPASSPVLGRGIAYTVTMPIPAEITGPDATLYFDLFDNQNHTMSLGWYTSPRISSVPEPQMTSLFILVLTGALIIRRKRTRGTEKT